MEHRDAEIRRASEAAKVKDTLILQKINASHRIAFAEKYPNQVEHILRLITERLQAGLDKRDGVEIDNPDTWKLSCNEILNLSQAMLAVHTVRNDIKAE